MVRAFTTRSKRWEYTLIVLAQFSRTLRSLGATLTFLLELTLHHGLVRVEHT